MIVSDLMHAVFTVYEHWIRVANIVVDKVSINQEVFAQHPLTQLRVPVWEQGSESLDEGT